MHLQQLLALAIPTVAVLFQPGSSQKTVIDCLVNKCVKIEDGILKKGNDIDLKSINCTTATTCNLEKKGITAIEKDAFLQLHKLTSITLRENSFTSIEPATFYNNFFLETLLLDINLNLTKLEVDVFSKATSLTYVGLSNNQFTSLPENLFSKNEKLENVLLFYSKRLTSLPAGLFSKNKELKSVDLSNSAFTGFPENIFNQNPKLNSVLLGGNAMCGTTSLPQSLFANNPELETIRINKMELEKLPVNLLKNNPKLTYLDLGDNENLKVVPEGFLDSFDFAKIKLLDFSRCVSITKFHQSYKAKFKDPNLSNSHLAGITLPYQSHEISFNEYFDCSDNQCSNQQRCESNGPVNPVSGKFACPTGSALEAPVQPRKSGPCDKGSASSSSLSLSLVLITSSLMFVQNLF